MFWASPIFAVLLSSSAGTPAVASDPIPDQTLVFYNARIALRENKSSEVLKLWLLRNSLENLGAKSRTDAEFHSVVWAALGDLGLCQDGFPKDEGGAGLWPLALHNAIVRTGGRPPPMRPPSSFDAFVVGRQQRLVSLNDVLDQRELRSVSFFRSRCLAPRLELLDGGYAPWGDLRDRLVSGLVLRQLLAKSLDTLERDKVQNVAAVEARIFDLDLALAQLQARRARQAGRAAGQLAKSVGVSPQGVLETRAAAAVWPSDSHQAKFLRHSLTWTATEWLSLNRQRRLALFGQARVFATDEIAHEKMVLSIIDALVQRGSGDEVELWIGFLEAGPSQRRRRALTTGDRGKRLLALDRSSGFRERAVISLERGIAFLEAGEMHEALRAFAFTLANAEESRQSAAAAALARRWLSYVLARYETSDEVIVTLKALVPAQEYNAVIEDLVWRSALRADSSSFERIATTARRGSSLDARIERLRPLAHGKAGEFVKQLRTMSVEEPFSMLRFAKQLVEQLESEEVEVRAANAPMLKLLVGLLDSLAGMGDERKSQTRVAEELLARTQAVLEGLRQLDATVSTRARALAPGHEAFAGNIRLAPSDPLPWPFRAPEVEPPSAFIPFNLQPVEWRDAKGALVFGWRLSE